MTALVTIQPPVLLLPAQAESQTLLKTLENDSPGNSTLEIASDKEINLQINYQCAHIQAARKSEHDYPVCLSYNWETIFIYLRWQIAVIH